MKPFPEQIHEVYSFEPTAMVMHFIPAVHFTTLLNTGKLHFGRIDLQEKDSNDGRLPRSNATGFAPSDIGILSILGLRGEAAAKFLRNHSDSAEPSRRRIFIHSWTLHDRESRSLWDVYGAKGKGFCIRTTVERLKRSIGIGSGFPGRHKGDDGLGIWVELMRVPYPASADRPPLPTIPSVWAGVSKGLEFSADNEARLVASVSPDEFYRVYEETERTPPKFRTIPVDLSCLLGEVIVGPNVDATEAKELAALADQIAGRHISHPSALDPYI